MSLERWRNPLSYQVMGSQALRLMSVAASGGGAIVSSSALASLVVMYMRHVAGSWEGERIGTSGRRRDVMFGSRRAVVV